MGTKCSSASAIIDFKKAYDSVRMEALCNILIEFDIPIKLLRLIKISLIETYSESEQAHICLTGFLIRMVWNKATFYVNFF